MSNRYLNIVKSHSAAKRSARAVLTIIADHADNSGAAWPGNELLADETGLTLRTVQRAIQRLETMGEIEITDGGSGRGNKRIIRITVSLPEAEKVTNLHPLDDEKRVTSAPEKGDNLTEKVTNLPIKGDNLSFPPIYEPSVEPSIEPNNPGAADAATQPPLLPVPEDDAKERRKAIKTAYLEALGHTNVNHGQVGAGVKQLEKGGFTPEQVTGCYLWLKQDPFWQYKPVSPQTIFKHMDEFLRFREQTNGNQDSRGTGAGRNGTHSRPSHWDTSSPRHPGWQKYARKASEGRALTPEEVEQLRANINF